MTLRLSYRPATFAIMHRLAHRFLLLLSAPLTLHAVGVAIEPASPAGMVGVAGFVSTGSPHPGVTPRPNFGRRLQMLMRSNLVIEKTNSDNNNSPLGSPLFPID